jgi:hypothetical protein
LKCTVGEQGGYGLAILSANFTERCDFRDFVGEGDETENLAEGLAKSVTVQPCHHYMFVIVLYCPQNKGM